MVEYMKDQWRHRCIPTIPLHGNVGSATLTTMTDSYMVEKHHSHGVGSAKGNSSLNGGCANKKAPPGLWLLGIVGGFGRSIYCCTSTR